MQVIYWVSIIVKTTQVEVKAYIWQWLIILEEEKKGFYFEKFYLKLGKK